MWWSSTLGTYLCSQGFLFQITTVQFDWIFIFVCTHDWFALVNDFHNFGTVTTFGQFFDDNLFLQITSVIDEAQFVEETFTEFLNEQKKAKNLFFKLKLIVSTKTEACKTVVSMLSGWSMTYLCFSITNGSFWIGAEFSKIFGSEWCFDCTIFHVFFGNLFLLIGDGLRNAQKFGKKLIFLITIEIDTKFLVFYDKKKQTSNRNKFHSRKHRTQWWKE